MPRHAERIWINSEKRSSVVTSLMRMATGPVRRPSCHSSNPKGTLHQAGVQIQIHFSPQRMPHALVVVELEVVYRLLLRTGTLLLTVTTTLILATALARLLLRGVYLKAKRWAVLPLREQRPTVPLVCNINIDIQLQTQISRTFDSQDHTSHLMLSKDTPRTRQLKLAKPINAFNDFYSRYPDSL